MQVIELPLPTVPDAIGFAPDGRALAVLCHGYVFVLDTVAGSVRKLKCKTDSAFSFSVGVAFTADGKGLVVPHSLRKPPVIAVHDVETGAVARDFALSNYQDVCEPGPGGRWMYVAPHLRGADWRNVGIVRWNPLTGEQLPPFAKSAYTIVLLAVSGDEKWIASGGYNMIRLWNIGGKKPPTRVTRQFKVERVHFVSLTLSANGAYLAAGSTFGQSGAIHVAATKTGEIWQIGEKPHTTDRGVAFHPSRPVLAASGVGGDVMFYDASARTELRRYTWPLDAISAVGFSPDGLRCAAAGPGKVVVWDVDV